MVFDSITDKINYLIEHNYIETAFIKKYRPEFFGRIVSNLSKNKTSNSSLSWLPISSIINMPWRLTTVNTILKAWKTVSSLATLFRWWNEAVTNRCCKWNHPPTLPTCHLPSWMLDVLVIGELVSCFIDSGHRWHELYWTFYQLCPSTFTYRWWSGNFPQQTFVKLVHLSKGYEGEQLLGSFQLWSFSKIASLTQTNWVNVKVLVLSTSTSSTQISSLSFQLRKKTPMKKFVSRPFHLVLWCPINSTNLARKMKKCTSSAHTL